MNTPAEIYIERDSPWARVYMAYDPDLITELKERLPSHARRWEPVERCWFVLQTHDGSGRIIRQVIPALLRMRSSTSTTPPKQSTPAGDPLLALFSIVPLELKQKLYRHLALVFHPDNGGTNDLMKRLNATWERVK